MIRSGLISILLCVVIAAAQKTGSNGDVAGGVMSEQETLARVQNQLLGAMAMLESLEEGKQTVVMGDGPLKAEKRRNKFEFIRFGRK